MKHLLSSAVIVAALLPNGFVSGKYNPVPRINATIVEAVNAGDTHVRITCDELTWKQEKMLAHKFLSMGYNVQVEGGVEGINSALELDWK